MRKDFRTRTMKNYQFGDFEAPPGGFIPLAKIKPPARELGVVSFARGTDPLGG
jgi:hypothetical protein